MGFELLNLQASPFNVGLVFTNRPGISDAGSKL
jgi:hypothetical protein